MGPVFGMLVADMVDEEPIPAPQAPWPPPDPGRTLSRGGPRSPSRDTADHEE
ncbi:hypothetical protein [Brachybacterium sacelli]|uniref:hypothetical protein n=1 Tax=Brachybacterium sacelli TaxID=173364 RepID=UPI00361BDAFF